MERTGPRMVPGTDFPEWKTKRRGGAKALRIHRAAEAQRRAEREDDKNRIAGVVLRGDGIGYKDQRLGTLRQAKSRSVLDRHAYTAWLQLLESQGAVAAKKPMSLRGYAVEAAANAYGEAGLWFDLPHELAFSVPALCSAVHRRVSAIAPPGVRAHLPFQFWANVSASFGHDVPGRFKTYRGLVLSDREEFKALGVLNENAAEDWAAEVAEEEGRKWREGPRHRPRELECPTFFLTILDLSGDITFTNDDVHQIKGVAQTLAVLKLDGTLLTDEGLRWITSGIDDDGAYSHLEVFTLRATKVTDDGVVKLGRLNSLRMLDLRNTKCSPRIVPLLYRAATQSLPDTKVTAFRAARVRPTVNDPTQYPPQLKRRLPPTLELQLFGGSHSPARTLGLLRVLAALEASPTAPPLRWIKPSIVHVDGVVRAPPGPSASLDGIYQQIGAMSGPARALHRSEYGVVTSTSWLDREAFREDGAEEGQSSGARTPFSVRNDAVAGGAYEGQGKTGGRVTRSEHTMLAAELEPLSDSEAEEERAVEAKHQEEEDLRLQAQDAGRYGTFYSAPRPVRRVERRFVAPEVSPFMLLRHLPCPDPFHPAPIGALAAAAPAGGALAGTVPGPKRILAGDTLAKKKPRKGDDSHLDFLPPTMAKARSPPTLMGRPAARHSPQAASPLPPSSVRSTSVAPSSLLPATPPSSYLGQSASPAGTLRPGKLANRFASQGQGGDKATKAATRKPSSVAGQKPLPVSVPNKTAKPLFQQRFH